MPWLDTLKSGFLPAFEWFWNDWASTCRNLVFIVAGSSTSWMVDHLSNNKGGLFRRQTCRLYLEPFKLFEVEEYLKSKNIFWSRYDIAECYMIMGGIPYYLSQLRGSLSLAQNIDHMFFKKNGVLWDEFEQLYHTLFMKSESYIKVVEALSEKHIGLTRNELIEKLRSSTNGNLTLILKNLMLTGLVRASSFYGYKKKNTVYKLSDYYTSFYFRFIKDHYGQDDHYWTNSIDNTSRRAWTGYAFEQLCMDHIPQTKHKLGISGVLSEQFTWFTHSDDEMGIKGAQIDLLIERRDRVINICEMKYSINDYVIDKDYDAVLRNKIDTFRRLTNCRESLQLTLVTTYGVKKNKYSNIAQSQVILDDLFHQ